MPKRQTARIDRASVVAAALQMVDADGLEAFTLRRLAAATGVQAASLYWHFKDKQDILSEMAQQMLASLEACLAPPEDPTEWAPWLERVALSLRGAMLARRDGARIVAGADLGRATTLAEVWATGVDVLVGAGFEPLPATHVVTTLITYTFGYVIEEQSFPAAALEGPHPHEGSLTHFERALSAMDSQPPDEGFMAGVHLILGGALVTLAARGAGA